MSHMLHLQRWNVIVRDHLEARHEGAKAFITAWVCGAGDSCQGPAPEVPI